MKPSRKHQTSKAWKARNPDWWKGRKYVQLLTSALVRGNAKSKVFQDAGMTMDQWIDQCPCLANGGLGCLQNGHKLAPIVSWRDCLKTPAPAILFLEPGNFKLVSK